MKLTNKQKDILKDSADVYLNTLEDDDKYNSIFMNGLMEADIDDPFEEDVAFVFFYKYISDNLFK